MLMPQRRRSLAPALVLLLVALLLLVTASPVLAAATLTLSASSGASGSSVRASGAGYRPGEMVVLRWNGISGTQLARTAADAAGSFSGVAVAVPSVDPGDYFIWAVGDESISYANASYTVTGNAPTPAPTASTTTPTATVTATASPTSTAIPATTVTATATPTPSRTPAPTPAPGVTLLPAGPLPSAGAPVAVAVHPGTQRLYVVQRAIYADLKVNADLLPTDRVSVVDQTTGRVVAVIPVGNALNGSGQGIAVDPRRNRVFVTNADDDTVSVIDTATNAVIATVQVGDGPAGVAVDSERGLVYVANSFGRSVSVLDASTGQVTGAVEVAGRAAAVAVDPVTHLAWVTVNAAPWTAVAVDGQTMSVQGSVPFNLLLSLSGIAVDPGVGVYVVDYDSGQIAMIDLSVTPLKEAWRQPAGLFPLAVAFDAVSQQVFVTEGGTNELAVLDRTGVRTTTIPTLRRPTALALDAAARRLAVTDTLSDSLTVIDLDRLAVAGHIPLGTAPFGVAYDDATQRIYVANYPADAIAVIDSATGALAASWPAGAGPFAVVADAAVQQVYSLNYDDQSLSVLSMTDGTVKTAVRVGSSPVAVAVDHRNHRVYATGSNGLTVLDGTTNRVLATVDVGSRPAGIAVDEASNRVYVASLGAGMITVLDAETNQVTATWRPRLTSVWGLALDPGLGRLFVTIVPSFIGDFSGVLVLDTATGETVAQAETGNRAGLVAVNPRTHQVFVTDSADGTLTVLDGATGGKVTAVAVGNQPNGIAVAPATGLVYVGNVRDGTVAVVDPARLDSAPAAVPTPAPVPSPTPTAPAPPEDSVRKEVGRHGGVVDVRGGAAAGGVTVSFPADAVSTGINVTVSVEDRAPAGTVAPSGSVLLNKTIEVTPEWPVVLGRAVRIRVGLRATDLGGHPISAVRIGVVIGMAVDPKPTRVIDAAAGIIEAEVDHFTKFSVTAATGPVPTLTGPADRATLDSMNASLTWTNPPGTTQYHLQIIPFSGDGPGADVVRNAESSYTMTAPDFGGSNPNYMLLPGMTYSWRVRTTDKPSFAPADDPSWSAWSVRTFFTPPTTSASITLMNPTEGSTVSTLTPTLTWLNRDRTVFYYEVQVSKDPAFNADPGSAIAAVYWELRHGAVTDPANSYTVPTSFPLEPGTLYHWRVRPRVQGDGLEVAWPDTRSFMTPPS